MSESPSCFVIGSDPTVVEYVTALQGHGHDVRGVISSNVKITSWARSAGLRVVDPAVYLSALLERPFDHLFVITEPRALPAEVLALPVRGIIEVHGGPLPRYAGVSSPSWAILNGEESFGVTWFRRWPGERPLEVLKQSEFEIAPRETALTLNAKCFESALETLHELLEAMASDRLEPRALGTEGASYFGPTDRPPSACVLDWARSATSLDGMVRALAFGHGDNPLGAAKIVHAGRAIVVTAAEPDERRASAAPGDILAIGEDGIVVQTAEFALRLVGFSDLAGREMRALEVASDLGLQPQARLAPLEPLLAKRLTAIDAEVCCWEGFWVDRLSTSDPLSLPYVSAERAARPGTRKPAASARYEIPPPLVSSFGGERVADALTAALAVYLARIADKPTFQLGFKHAALSDLIRGAESLFATVVPLAVNVPEGSTAGELMGLIQEELATTRRHLTWSRDLAARFQALRGKLAADGTGHYPVVVEQQAHADQDLPPGTVLSVCIEPAGSSCVWTYDQDQLSGEAVLAMQEQLSYVCEQLVDTPSRPVWQLDVLPPTERERVVVGWNQTRTEYRRDACVDTLIEEQVERTPDSVAVTFEGDSLTYRQLDARANQLAHHLIMLGVARDGLVGVHVRRSLDLLVATLAIWKAGGAYVPLDPDYPTSRIENMIDDSAAGVILTQDSLVASLRAGHARVVRIDSDWGEISAQPATRPAGSTQPHDLAYVIYTSGSTGKPKGVLVEHRNVVSFFRGMDDVVPHEERGTWLAVTSLSFDISVLELFWTLTHGFHVILFVDRERDASGTSVRPPAARQKGMDLSLFYFSADEAQDQDKYRLLLEGAKFGDQNGFCAVWTPERHFHAFGGLYPDPAVTGAAIATVTERIQIRAGSVVVPLNEPLRVAERWAMVDNLSHGRAAVAFASGWFPNDFVLMPERYERAKEILIEEVALIRRLWRGESVIRTGPKGPVEVRTLPRPVQRELPTWITTGGNPETYVQAGAMGANVLTHLLGQSIEDLPARIEAYRRARQENGHDPTTGVVSLMLHTFVGQDAIDVRQVVRGPLREYLGTSLGLLKQHAATFFAAFTRPEAADPGDLLGSLSDEERDALLEHAFERYFETSGLFGSPEDCVALVDRLSTIGVDEIACLIDFGVSTDTVLAALPHLARLREMVAPRQSVLPGEGDDLSLQALIRRYRVTHLQCTPSMARMILLMDGGREALREVRYLMIGGEALPANLARELFDLDGPTITNMYGPTETTIWSSTHRLRGVDGSVPIGRPIANTRLYVLDRHLQPVPPGVPGELFIGGEGVVRGYHRRPELTAERFVADPFLEPDRGRMYRTGDRVRFRADGVVEYLGRIDHQLKIHGHRIEPGEIENVLQQHPSVRESVVVAHESAPGDVRLVAYVVASDVTPSVASLRDHLRSSLPDYMVPGTVVFLAQMPLTPNGKVDRACLPAPDQAAVSAAEYVPPEGELERQITGLWEQVLGVARVGIDDNFFDLGGHSLLVVGLHRRLRDELTLGVALTDLYRFPTIRRLVAHLTDDTQGDRTSHGLDRAARRRAVLKRRRVPGAAV